MKTGSVTGKIKGDIIHFSGEGDNELVITNLVVGSEKFPLVASKYLLTNDVKNTNVCVIACLKSTTINDKLFTYLYAVNLVANENKEKQNIMFAEGKINNIESIRVVKKGSTAVLMFKVSYKNEDNTYDIVHCRATNIMAYKLKDLQKYDKVLLKGFVRKLTNRICIQVEEIILIDKNNNKK